VNASDKFARLAALKPTRALPSPPATLRTPDDDDEIARFLGAGVACNHFGEHLAIRNWFSTPEFSSPASVTLELLSRTRDEALSRRTRVALENPDKWLFLDTETTGLAGGTGTYAFLIGLAWWDAGGLQVEQLFLRDFSEEYSLLQELAARIAERSVLVTFNGKTFDWPLLESRFTMTRSIKIPQLSAHLDLLHPARALWKFRLGSVRLVELERHVLDARRLGWHREDEVISSLIPQLYFDYLRGGSPLPLAAVLKHNQMDLRGLAALYGKINSLLDERDSSLDETEALDLFGLSRFLNRRGERDRAHSVCSKALEAGLPALFRSQATRELALLAKRCGETEAAASLWYELVSDPHDGISACEQLALHYERREKNYARAVEFTQLALLKLRRQRLPSSDPLAAARAARLQEKLTCRLDRLQHRIERLRITASEPLLADSAVAASGGRPRQS
jgi:uncharacterized protein YprB with RNaseH-like and TPR domain